MKAAKGRKGRHLGLRRGARELADFIFGDEEEWEKVYALKDKLGLFKLNGLICGREQTIEARVAALETPKADPTAV
jgi:hypothetical protein